jgi:hypothetical protein
VFLSKKNMSKRICEVVDMLVSVIRVIISQSICISNHKIVHFLKCM